jgi:hypothetical protein
VNVPQPADDFTRKVEIRLFALNGPFKRRAVGNIPQIADLVRQLDELRSVAHVASALDLLALAFARG